MLKLINHPSFTHAHEIGDICAPLKKLNISYFGHVRISHDKKFSAISSNPFFMEHYLNNKFFEVDIHMVDESKFGHFFVWDGIEFSGKSGMICREAADFNIHNPFTIIERNKDGIDYYHFANNSRNKQINQTYLANLDLLELFISHFKERINQSKTLHKAYDFTIDISNHQNISLEDDSMKYDRNGFILSFEQKIPSSRLIIENTTLSKRQSEILKYVVQGKTLKEISHILGLSHRTVGHYFDMIKIKLNVTTKSELISKSLEFLYKDKRLKGSSIDI